MSMFLGLSIPNRVQEVISSKLSPYEQYIEHIIPPDSWHITLLYLGEVENPKQYYSRLKKPLSQAFLPTVHVAFLGRGHNRLQLWAYVEASALLTAVRGSLVQRCRSMRLPIPPNVLKEDFIPHIAVARLYGVARSVGIADEPVSCTFAARQVHLFQSTQKEVSMTL